MNLLVFLLGRACLLYLKCQYKSLIVANYRQNPVKTGFFIFYCRLKSFIVACNRSIFVVCFVVRQPTYYKDYESY